jgi:outer membrane receptor protein involved in Fe transport
LDGSIIRIIRLVRLIRVAYHIELNICTLILVLILGGGGASPLAFSQDSNRSSVKISEQESLKEAQGRVLILAFRNGEPSGGVTFEHSSGTYLSAFDGSLMIDLPPGGHSFYIPELERKLAIQVNSGEETQVIVSLLHQRQKSEVSVKVPTGASSEGLKSGESGSLLQVKVVDESSGRPLSGGLVIFSGYEDTLTTNSEGQVEFRLSDGEYSLSIFHPKYQTKTLSGVKVGPDTNKPLVVSLTPAINELEEVTILAPKIRGSVSALIEVRRQSSSVTDVMGSEQMSRQGDSDAASSLRRMTGLTLKDGKYVYVRGLGERYSGVQLNQFSLPSPEPNRRVVPLDLFPTAILESVLVQKSYSPDLPGEFGGGVIQLQSRTLPEKFSFKFSLSSNQESADQRLSSRGGGLDWAGIDNGTRKMPPAIRGALQSGKKLVLQQPGSSEGISEAELVQLGRSLPANYATNRTSEGIPPGFSLAIADRFRIGAARSGIAGSILYGQNADRGERFSRGLNAMSPGRYSTDYNRTSEYAEVETRLAGQVDFGIELNQNNTLSLSSMLLRHTTNFTQQDLKQDPNSTSSIESTTLDWTERQLWTNHLKGKHKLGTSFGQDIEGSWRIGQADAIRDNPDRREYAFERTPTSYQMRGDSGGNRRTYSLLTDRSQEVAADLILPLGFQRDRLKLKFGASEIKRGRRSEVFRLFFSGDTSGDPIESQLSLANIGPGGFQLQNLTDAADSYRGDQNTVSQYAMADFGPFANWKFLAGYRWERSVQTVNTFRYYEPENPFSQSRLEMKDVLPSFAVLWKPNQQWRARLAYSETLARPDFRELSEVGFIDDETGYEVRGNSSLRGTIIQNIDHRWEYYWSPDEYASSGLFFKKFRDPIEVMFVPGVNRIQTFSNAMAAENFGLELESRIGLRKLSRIFRRWSILSNLTFIRSEIELDEKSKGIQTSQQRPLQGQAPYVVNFQLQYDRPLWDFSATLLYSLVGERISEVGTNNIPDTYQNPSQQLDFVASKAISKVWTVALKAKNLLDPAIESFQDKELVRKTHNGRSIGLNMTAIF